LIVEPEQWPNVWSVKNQFSAGLRLRSATKSKAHPSQQSDINPLLRLNKRLRKNFLDDRVIPVSLTLLAKLVSAQLMFVREITSGTDRVPKVNVCLELFVTRAMGR
jgi:hypothetical protein